MTELKIEKVTEDSPLKAKVQRIYIKSFPLFERVSLEPFFNSVSDGVEIFALSDEEDVVAFFCTLRKGKLLMVPNTTNVPSWHSSHSSHSSHMSHMSHYSGRW